MDAFCGPGRLSPRERLRAAIAAADTAMLAHGWKRVPRKATPQMLKDAIDVQGMPWTSCIPPGAQPDEYIAERIHEALYDAAPEVKS